MYKQILFHTSVDVLKKEWAKLRDNYRKTLSKREKATRSGAGNKKPLPTCNYFTELSFLHDNMASRSCESNIPLAITDPMPNISDHTEDIENTDFSSVSSVGSPPQQSTSKQIPEMQTPSNKFRKRKQSTYDDSRDTLLIKTLGKHLEPTNESKQVSPQEPEDDNRLFCLSLVETLKSLDARENALARLKIQQILFDIKFGKE